MVFTLILSAEHRGPYADEENYGERQAEILRDKWRERDIHLEAGSLRDKQPDKERQR